MARRFDTLADTEHESGRAEKGKGPYILLLESLFLGWRWTNGQPQRELVEYHGHTSCDLRRNGGISRASAPSHRHFNEGGKGE